MTTPPPVPLIAEAEQWAETLTESAEWVDARGADWFALKTHDARELASLLQRLLPYCRAAAARI